MLKPLVSVSADPLLIHATTKLPCGWTATAWLRRAGEEQGAER